MFYFKTISINNVSPQLIEEAIRHYTKLRSSYVDFIITAGEIHDNKYFAGLEKKNELLITRMKEQRQLSIFGDYRPKRYRNAPAVFVRFKKDTGFSSYQIRLGFFSTIIFFIVIFWFAFNIWLLFHGHIEFTFLISTLFLISYLYITYREISNTRKLINKVIELKTTH